MSRILIVEDEEHLAQGLRFNFEAEGHSVQTTDRGEDALTRLLKHKENFDALVLDVMLPGKDGFAVARELREAKNFIPVLILIARVESLLRRKQWTRDTAATSASPERAEGDSPDVYRFDDKVVDFRNLQLRAGDNVVQLTVMEADLLRYLIKNAGHPVSRKAILQDVWNLHEETDTRAIDSFIVRLRKYIEAKPAKPRYLLTVRGLGYQFVAEPKSSARS